MAAGSVQVDSTTGYPKVSKATGFPLVTGASDACCCGSSLCSLCDAGTTPTTILLSLTGFSITVGCQNLCGTTDSYKSNTFDINHDFCLPACNVGGSIPNGCAWADVFTGRVDIDVWCNPASGTCAGTRSANFTLLGILVWRFSANIWHVQLTAGDGTSGCLVTASCVPGCGGLTLNSLVDARKGEFGAITDCSSTQTCDDVLTGTGITGGTVIITPDGC